MTVSVDWGNKVVLSTASITDLPSFKDTIRALEEGATGMLYPAIISYKKVDLGGGAYFHACDFLNDYSLKFVGGGPFTINGNLNCTIVDTGVQVERKTSAAFSTTSTEGGSAATSGLTDTQAAQLSTILALLKNKTVTDPVLGKITYYANDDTTPMLTANLFEDAAGTQPYRGQGAERKDRAQ